MRRMMQKLLLVRTDTFLPEMRAVDVQGWTQGDSQNMLVRNQNLRVLGIGLRTESRAPRLCWNVTLQSVQKQFKKKIKSSYQGTDAENLSTSFTKLWSGSCFVFHLKKKPPHSLQPCPLLLTLCFLLLAVLEGHEHPLPCAGTSPTLLWTLAGKYDACHN